jgi:hypothetical protein
MGTFVVGTIFAAILFFAAKKGLSDLKKGKCAGCSGCDSNKTTKDTCQIKF